MRIKILFTSALAAAVLFAAACKDDDTGGERERVSTSALSVDLDRCGPEDASALASALDVELSNHGTMAGTYHNEDVSFGQNTCWFETADGARFTIAKAHADDDPMDAWEKIRARAPEDLARGEVAEWAKGTGLKDRVDELVTRPGRGVAARIGEAGYWVMFSPHATSDDEVTSDDLRRLATVVAGVLDGAPTEPRDVCERLEEVAGEYYDEASGSGRPGWGQGTSDGESYDFRTCSVTVDDDARLMAHIGDLNLFTARAETKDTSHPFPLKDLDVEALAWNRRVFVPVGDELLIFSGTDDGILSAEELVPFVRSVISL